MVTQAHPDLPHSGLVGTLNRVLPLGLGVAVGVWIIWFLLNFPGVDLAPKKTSLILLGAWLVLASVGARICKTGLKDAAIAGLITSLIGLLALGTELVNQPVPAQYGGGTVPLRPNAALIVLGYLAAGAFIGALGAVLSGTTKPTRTKDTPWLSRMAIVVACSYIPLLLIGSLVTSTESGMAVPGWPNTYGTSMFLYPLSLMSQPRIFLEHSHRLFGSMAGVSTILLWLLILLNPIARKKFGIWSTILVLAVGLQGVLGGQRVVLNNPYLGALHGVFGQVVVAFAAVLALWMSPRYQSLTHTTLAPSRKTRVLTTAALHTTLVQLLIGAMYRHLRRAGIPEASHIVWAHIAFSLLVVLLVIIAGSALIKMGKHHAKDLPDGVAMRIKLTGVAMHAVVGLQFVLGWGAFLAVMTSKTRNGIPTAEALNQAAPVPLAEAALTTIHQANGALLLVLVMLGWAWSMQLFRAMRAQ